MATEKLSIGSIAPSFNGLPGIDGKSYSLTDFSKEKFLVIVFSCNHCPYVQAYEDRMIAFAKAYGPKGARLVAINANETDNYPEDSFEEMVKRGKKKGFPFPYLRDEDQRVADAFGATHTPEFFVFDNERRLRYHGKMDDNYQNAAAVKHRYLTDAVDALLDGKPVQEPETYSIGCTIKWRLG
jgi:thiol-disulfide isomerase/thioredoxin